MNAAECILLLEPDIVARQNLADYLRDCGYKVIEATSAAEARSLLEAPVLSIDMLLADAGADASAVFALAQWVRRTLPSLPVILAGNIEKAAAEAGDLCNDGPALVKPYDHQLVVQQIKRQLAARQKK
jgi:DNA-binding NtrC family response regulator